MTKKTTKNNSIKISIISICTCFILIAINILYANFGVWTGRNNDIHKFDEHEDATISEVQEIYAKKNFLFFISNEFFNLKDREKAVSDFWNSQKNTNYTYSNEPATLEMVNMLYTNAKDTKRSTLYYNYILDICLIIILSILIYIISILMLITSRKKEYIIILSLIFYNIIFNSLLHCKEAIYMVIFIEAAILIKSIFPLIKNKMIKCTTKGNKPLNTIEAAILIKNIFTSLKNKMIKCTTKGNKSLNTIETNSIFIICGILMSFNTCAYCLYENIQFLLLAFAFSIPMILTYKYNAPENS